MAEAKRGRPAKEKKEEVVEPEPTSIAEKQRLDMDKYVAAVGKKLGEGSIIAAKDAGYKAIPRISTGIFQLDYALSGGIPRGRVTLLTGEESSSKSRLCYAIIADAQMRSMFSNHYLWEEMPEEQKLPYRCLYVDVEGCHTNEWAEACGVLIDSLYLARPSSQEEACEIILSALASGNYDLICTDSVDSMIPTEDLESAFDESSGYGTTKAKNNGKLFRRIQARLNEAAKAGTEIPTCVFVNQVRKKIGGFQGGNLYPGGDAQKFYSSVILELSKGKTTYFDGEKKEPATVSFHFRVVKNKVGKPKINGEYEMGLVDHPRDTFRKGEFIDHLVVYQQAEKLGIIDATEKHWQCYGDKFNTKKELYQVYFRDLQKYLSLKYDVLSRIYPRQ